jgi:hypothetical protein
MGILEQVFLLPLSLRLRTAESTLRVVGFPETVRHFGKAAPAQTWLYIKDRMTGLSSQ